MNMKDWSAEELRRMLASRQREKAELELQVGSFESKVQEEIDPIQEQVLRVQMERLKEAAQSQMQNARLRNAYHDAQEAYERFAHRREDESRAASSEEALKSTYRRASKQCHPDAVPPRYEEDAAATFQALERAYEGEHRPAVEAIAESLEKWGFPSQREDRATDLNWTEKMRTAVASLQVSIDSLRSSDAYRAVRQASDLDAAIDAQKRQLARHLRELQRERRGRSRRH